MTKKWSSTASMDGQTKRQASKSERRAVTIELDECEGCGENLADPPSMYCPGCQAYRDHQQ